MVVGNQEGGSVWLCLGKFLEGRGKKTIDCLVEQSNAKNGGLYPCNRRGIFHCALQIQHQRTDPLIKHLTCLRQLYRTVAPMKQQEAQLLFQRTDLLAHGGLGNEVIPGGIGEALGFRYGNEIVNLLDGQGKQPPFEDIIP